MRRSRIPAVACALGAIALLASGCSSGQQAGPLYIDGHDVGGDAVRTLVAKIRNGTPLPSKTIAKTQIVDARTAGQTTLKCT